MGDLPKRKIAPFPIEIVALHPLALALPAAGFGMLFRILTHYWMTDLKPLPKAESELYTIARAQRPTWVAHKATILQILADITPVFAQRHETWLTRRRILAHVQDRAAEARRQQGRARRAERAADNDDGKLDIQLLAAVSKQKQGNRAAEAREQHARKRAASGFQD